MRVLPHQLCSRRAYASQVATSIPAFRRPCTPPAGFWAAPGYACSAPFSSNTQAVGASDALHGVGRPEGRDVQVMQAALARGVFITVNQLETRLQLTANLLFHRM